MHPLWSLIRGAAAYVCEVQNADAGIGASRWVVKMPPKWEARNAKRGC